MATLGKSTLLKLIEELLYGKRMIIRGVEKNRDWFKLLQSQNGKIDDLSGKEGMLNPMEPLATITDSSGKVIDDLSSYLQHRATFFNKVRFLNPAIHLRIGHPTFIVMEHILPVAKIVYRQKTLERNFSFARLLLCKNK